MVDIALSIPPSQKISRTSRKIVLRKIAKDIGLPKYIYERPKKAAQYGSGSLKTIKKLAKEAGFSSICSYLEELYKQLYKK